MEIPYCPLTPTPSQEKWLITGAYGIYGGRVRGKSTALLMAALLRAYEPYHRSLILTTDQGALYSAFIRQFMSWLDNYPQISWDARQMQATFPNRGTLRFDSLEGPEDYKRFHSYGFQFIGFDRASLFAERDIRYLLSRLRANQRVKWEIRFTDDCPLSPPGFDMLK